MNQTAGLLGVIVNPISKTKKQIKSQQKTKSKRAPSAYNLFVKANRHRIADANPTASFGEITRSIHLDELDFPTCAMLLAVYHLFCDHNLFSIIRMDRSSHPIHDIDTLAESWGGSGGVLPMPKNRNTWMRAIP